MLLGEIVSEKDGLNVAPSGATPMCKQITARGRRPFTQALNPNAIRQRPTKAGTDRWHLYELGCGEVGWDGLGWAGLGRAGVDWCGVGWAGLGWGAVGWGRWGVGGGSEGPQNY